MLVWNLRWQAVLARDRRHFRIASGDYVEPRGRTRRAERRHRDTGAGLRYPDGGAIAGGACRTEAE